MHITQRDLCIICYHHVNYKQQVSLHQHYRHYVPTVLQLWGSRWVFPVHGRAPAETKITL